MHNPQCYHTENTKKEWKTRVIRTNTIKNVSTMRQAIRNVTSIENINFTICYGICTKSAVKPLISTLDKPLVSKLRNVSEQKLWTWSKSNQFPEPDGVCECLLHPAINIHQSLIFSTTQNQHLSRQMKPLDTRYCDGQRLTLLKISSPSMIFGCVQSWTIPIFSNKCQFVVG